MDLQSQALAELKRFKPEEAKAILAAQGKKRREKMYPLYFDAWPRQVEIIREWTKDIKIFGILGGNRSSKTTLGAIIAAAWALGKDIFRNEPAWDLVKDLPIPEKPNTIWVVGLDFPTLQHVIWGEKFRRGKGLPPLFPDVSPFLAKKPNDSDFILPLANGSLIIGKSADSGAEKFQGASIDLVWIDEECSVDVFDECYQRTVDCAGKILLTLTPLADIASAARVPWVYNLHKDWKNGTKKNVRFVKLSVLDNPIIPEDEKEMLKIKWAGHPEEGARLYGDFVQKAGLVYPMFSRGIHLIPRREIPRDWTKVVCIDPANTGPTAALWCAVDPQGNLLFYRAYKQSEAVVSDHAKNILAYNSGDLIDIWLIDPRWGAQRNGENHKTGAKLYQENGIPVRLAPNITESNGYGVNPSIEYLNSALNPTSRHPKSLFTNDLAQLIDEIEMYSWAFFAKGENKGMSKDKPMKGNDDLLNCFQYICAYRPRPRSTRTQIVDKEAVRFNSYTF